MEVSRRGIVVEYANIVNRARRRISLIDTNELRLIPSAFTHKKQSSRNETFFQEKK